MFTSRVVRSLFVAGGVCVLAGVGPRGRVSGQQAAPPQAEVTFRTDANFVLTDVFVTADGKPVTDLTQADFELREDGAVQTIQSFEAVRHDLRPVVGLPRKNPSSVAESEAMAADPRRRVFVIFLDTFHVRRGDAMWVRKQLLAFFKDSLGPDDLIAYMTPQMSGRDISFSISTDPILAYLDANPVWGVADEMAFTESDALERELSNCFPRDAAAWMALRSRLREQKSIQALRGLVAYLDGLRESRKAVIAVTAGWRLFAENPARMTDADNRNRIGGIDPMGVNAGGVLGPDDRQRVGGVTQGVCDAARQEGAMADSRQMLLDLIGEANRSSTSFYTVDARGLRSEGRPGTPTVQGPAISAADEMRNRSRAPYSTTLDSIRTLGESTNGVAIVDSNDVEGGMRRAAADFNAFYLLGYTSSNGKPDGKYRKIKVAVTRPGVRVRAREGYLARRIEDIAPATSTRATPGASTPATADAQFTAALGRLAPARPGVPLVVSGAAGAVAGSTARSIRVTAELDSAVAVTPEWADGGEAQAFVRNAKGDTVTMAKATLAKGARTVEIDLPVVDGIASNDTLVVSV